MAKTRTFIAVEASDDVRDRARLAIQRLRGATDNVKWVLPENLHWTLQFLGDIDDATMADVCRRVAATVIDRPPFLLAGLGVGAFPKIQRPRTLWLGAAEGGDALCQLQAAIQRSLDDLGFRGERRRFVPHLTLGRVGRGSQGGSVLAERLAKLANFEGGAMTVDEVTVFASELQREGPTYQVLSRAPLATRG